MTNKTKTKTNIEIERLTARDIQDAMRKIRKKYPYAKMVTYRFDKDYRFIRPKRYGNRTMSVAYIKNSKKIWSDLNDHI